MRPVLLALAAALALTAPAQAQTEPLQQTPGVPPPGANDWDCRSETRPYPVILVHGTFGDMTVSWNMLSPQLKAEGYCVFALDLVRRGTAPVEESAEKLEAFTREVLDRTGAQKVSFVGHSQGGMLARYVVKSRGLVEQADDVIGLAPSSHGTENPLADSAAELFQCPACADQKAGSEFMAKVNTPPEAPEPASYTVVSTRYDQVVVPYTSQALDGPTVTNVVLQDRCPNDPTEHVGIIYDPIASQWVRNALGRPGPADPGFRPDCSGLGNGTGGDGSPATGSQDERSASAAAPMRLEVSRKPVRLSKAGSVPLAIKCVGTQTCRGVAVLRHRATVVGQRRFTIAAGRKGTSRIRLARAYRRKLARRGSMRVTSTATVAQLGGTVLVATGRTTLWRTGA